MKKVTIVAHGLSDGGAERVASILANHFSRSGLEVTYICAYRNANNVNRKEYKVDQAVQVKYIEVPQKNHLSRFVTRNLKIRRAVKESEPDVVISFINYDTLFTALSGVPVIYTLRNDPSHVRQSKVRAPMFDLEYAKAKKIVFQTRGAQAYFSQKIQDKSVIITNPIETGKLPRWGEHEQRKVFATACRLNRQKNLPMLIDAFVKVHQKHPDYALEIYGDGELRETLTAKIAACSAQEYIRLMGYSNDVHSVMTTITGFVMSSDYEGLSNSMLEALCIGVPCICTDCPPGGAREYITSGENGLLTKVGDADDMAQKLCMVIEDEQLRQRFSENAMKYRETLDVKNICDQWLELIRQD